MRDRIEIPLLSRLSNNDTSDTLLLQRGGKCAGALPFHHVGRREHPVVIDTSTERAEFWGRQRRFR